MAEIALGALIAGVVLMLVTFAWILKLDGASPPVEEIPDAEEKLIWRERARESSTDFGLADIRAGASKWAASVASILAVLSSVAVVAGPKDLAKDVGGTGALTVGALVLAAGAIAAMATLLAALAAQGTPVWSELGPATYRTAIRARAIRAALFLRWSRILTVVALSVVLSATGVAWLTVLAPARPVHHAQFAIVVTNAGTHCGALANVGSDLMLQVDHGTPAAIPPNAVLTLVGACP
jgi:hypothetical protein